MTADTDIVEWMKSEIEKYEHDAKQTYGKERGRLLGVVDILQKAVCELERLRAVPAPSNGNTTQQSWKVWVRVGVGAQADFIEDITIYDCAEKPRYVRGTVTLDDAVPLPSPPQEGDTNG